MSVVVFYRFGFSGSDFYTFFTYKCRGREKLLSECQTNAAPTCVASDPLSAVAVDCNVTSEAGVHNTVSNA